MTTHRWRLVRPFAAPVLGLIFALCLAPAALAQPRYSNLTWVDRAGKVIETVGAPGEYRGLDVSPDGRRVATRPPRKRGGDSSGDGAPSVAGNRAIRTRTRNALACNVPTRSTRPWGDPVEKQGSASQRARPAGAERSGRSGGACRHGGIAGRDDRVLLAKPRGSFPTGAYAEK